MNGLGNEIFIVIVFWAGLSAFRTGHSLKTNTSFRFQWWEGGVLLTGKYLSRKVTQLRFALMLLLSVYSASLALGQISFQSGKSICLALLIGVFLMDLLLSTREEPLVIPSATIQSESDN